MAADMCMYAVTGTGQGQGMCGHVARGSVPTVAIGGIEAAGDNQLAVGSGGLQFAVGSKQFAVNKYIVYTITG